METRAPDQGESKLSAASPSFEAIAAQQGVEPIAKFEDLLGERHVEDESAEEFAKMLRNWRTEGLTAGSQR